MEVATVWVLETLHTGFCMQFAYAYVIWNFGNAEFMGGIYWSGGLALFLAVLIQVTVQWFVSSIMFPSSMLISYSLIPASTSGAFGSLYISQYRPSILNFDDRGIPCALSLWYDPIAANPLVTDRSSPMPIRFWHGYAQCWYGSSACIDVIVASVLIYYFKRGRSGLARSDNMLVWLSVYTVNTGALRALSPCLLSSCSRCRRRVWSSWRWERCKANCNANSFLGSCHPAERTSAHPQHAQRVSHDRALESSQFKTTVPCHVEILQETVHDGDTHSTSGTDVPSDSLSINRMANS
ncbi:hypothetical protein A0H81_10669 [Grifola frondosa]|uniref:DUF6534 domain-containing protein n=1 Tax=Grifola frondosa TaxID=5627 RepID=A0A1C7LXH7_GRIFR|nr:hypothetical protein A0H81_10669 [Grifola frondosa]